jgi:hypothetical protein
MAASPPSHLTWANKFVPIIGSKLGKAQEPSKSLVRLDLGYRGCETVCRLVAPKGEEPGGTSERISNRLPCLPYDAFDNFPPAACSSVRC